MRGWRKFFCIQCEDSGHHRILWIYLFPKRHKILVCMYIYICVCVCNYRYATGWVENKRLEVLFVTRPPVYKTNGQSDNVSTINLCIQKKIKLNNILLRQSRSLRHHRRILFACKVQDQHHNLFVWHPNRDFVGGILQDNALCAL